MSVVSSGYASIGRAVIQMAKDVRNTVLLPLLSLASSLPSLQAYDGGDYFPVWGDMSGL